MNTELRIILQTLAEGRNLDAAAVRIDNSRSHVTRRLHRDAPQVPTRGSTIAERRDRMDAAKVFLAVNPEPTKQEQAA